MSPENRKLISSGSPYEKTIGFSRAIRQGEFIWVAGTAPIADDGATYAPNDAYEQTKRCLMIIKKAIEEAGGDLKSVIRTRIYLTDMSCWEEVGRAHGEFFAEIRPVSTMVEVKSLVRPEWLVEIEAECFVAKK